MTLTTQEMARGLVRKALEQIKDPITQLYHVPHALFPLNKPGQVALAIVMMVEMFSTI